MQRDDDENVLEFFEERAAIMTFDGGMPRSDADYRAMVRARLYFEPRGIAMPADGYFSCYWSSEFGWNDNDGTVVLFPCRAVLLSMWWSAADEADRARRCYTWLLRPPVDPGW
ncbi:hypothetical protein WT72_30495 [Burkholderia pseudomultivorans]|uniref:hypothetical protein n=1 Tax=Burkholderia pseudomultivorans TaxID=1207504 RepID=UPI00075B97EA|nr:hypothetical protein [Burkholderia pseudomultivorans]KWI47851.1 hypothetical protein WT72_30495 [Burkholderia pseudomultivorans]